MLVKTTLEKECIKATYATDEADSEGVTLYAYEVNIIDGDGEIIQTNGNPNDDNPGTDAFDSLREYYGEQVATEILDGIPHDMSGHIPPTLDRLNDWESVLVRVTTENIQSALISFTPRQS